MTHLIRQWTTPPQVSALQTTHRCGRQESFDAQPDNNPALNQQLHDAGFLLPAPVRMLRQVHGDQVVEYQHSPQTDFQHKADACFTRQPGVVCAIMTADCLPVLLTDTAGSFVAAVHCGWRSLYAGILQQVVQAVNTNHPVLAWFGPCISRQNYQVTEGFRDHYLDRHPDAAAAFTSVISGHCQAGLTDMARQQLSHLNITRISQDGRCTFSDPSLYSWRQDHTPKRLASLIWLRQQGTP